MENRYHSFARYYKDQGFVRRVQKITVDAGFTCPNRDGTLSSDGCVFCNNEGFSPYAGKPGRSIDEQIALGIAAAKKKYGDCHILVYFQAYSNTYAQPRELKRVFDAIRKFPEVFGLAIGTRPDCVDREKLAMINTYTQEYAVWLEYGLQSMHNRTLRAINRGHTYEDFTRAIAATREFPAIKICAHVILGLPGETRDMMLATARELNALALDGLKIHPLHVVRSTFLEKLFAEGKMSVLTCDDYVALVVSFLEHTRPETVIQRLSADCPKQLLVAPSWILDKAKLLRAIEDRLKSEKTFQGKLYRHVHPDKS